MKQRRSIALFASALMATQLVSPAFAAALPVNQEQVARLGIRTAPVTLASMQSSTSVLGHVMPALNARVPVPAPFSGTVVAIEVLEGASVKAGDTLVILASRNVRDARAQLQALEAENRMAAAAAARSRQLSEEGIVSRARAEEDASRAASAAAAYAATREVLAHTSAVSGSADMYRLVSPVDGRVAHIEVMPGAPIAEMETAVHIDTGDELWIEARLPASEVGKVGVGDAIAVEGTEIQGRVVAAGNSIDPQTRSAVLRAVVPAEANLISGETVRVSVLRNAQAGALNVPRNAVVRVDNGFAVFVARADGFDVVPVDVLATGAAETTLLGALSPNDQVAVTGVSELKALALQD